MSTKQRIIATARTLFAVRGYEGTSMSDIAKGVGLNKASLYAHYSGKDELFLAVYREAAEGYEQLNRTLFEEAKEMPVSDQLFHLFQGYILYYHRNTEFAALWKQVVLFPPAQLREPIMADLAQRDRLFQQGLLGLFERAMKEGLVRADSPGRMAMAFRSMRDGLLSWMHTVPQVKEEWVGAFWSDLWHGLKSRKDEET